MNSINKKFSLVGKIALITGATGHLGQQMALALSEAGAHVLVNSRSSKNAMLLVKKIKQNKLIAEEAIFDVTEEKDVKNFFSSYDKKLNIIVNNSHAETFGTIEKSEKKQYELSYANSVIASQSIIKNALPFVS